MEMMTRLSGVYRLTAQSRNLGNPGTLIRHPLEVLVRMIDEADPTQLIMPAHFIPFAERNGKIVEIDRWVIRESVRLLSHSPHVPPLAVNISGRSFDQPDLPHYIAEQLQELQVAPQRLIVELTETLRGDRFTRCPAVYRSATENRLHRLPRRFRCGLFFLRLSQTPEGGCAQNRWPIRARPTQRPRIKPSSKPSSMSPAA